jgi:metallo-beta-lactamase class B
MLRKLFCVIACVASYPTFAALGQQTPAAPKPDNPQSLAHYAAAKKIAGADPVLAPAYNFFCIPANIRADRADAPELTPTKVFDNLYAVGHEETVVYAITTSEGIILIDGGRPEKGVVVEGLEKLGLNPANIKYVLISHGHGDHYAGSAYIQERYGARVGVSKEDWDLMYPATPSENQLKGRPKKDLVLTEGQPLTVGDTTINFVSIPGHTPGGIGFIFPVKDGGKTYMAGLFGGTIFTASRISTPAMIQYVDSMKHWVDVAKKMKVEVEIQNHPIFDANPERLAKLKARKPGEPHPFMMSTEKYAQFWNIISECMQTDIARR